jgi:hypothetical protein
MRIPFLMTLTRRTPTRNETGRNYRARGSLLAAFLFACLGCENTERISSTTADDILDPSASLASVSATGASGIPFGAFAQPLSVYGPLYTGGHLNPWKPEFLLSSLDTIQAARGRVVLALAGGPSAYTNADGTFNYELWQGRIDRYRDIQFDSYIEDGTVIGIYLVDEPNCSSCWGGQAIAQAMVETMAEYSKSIWPNMKTIVRATPTWLAAYSGQYVSLDAGWAQYAVRLGDINTYLANNVAAAQSKGLGLIVGLNALNGGLNQVSLTASEIKSFGSTLLGSSYACAFISYKYDAAYFSRSDIKSALEMLSKKAKRHAASSCSR